MRDQDDIRSLTFEEQEREAKQDGTGKIQKYLKLAEKFFSGDDSLTADAA
jgi:hypothetical protein